MQNTSFVDVKSNNMKFNKLNDFIVGTLINVNKTTQKDIYGKYAYIFTIKADDGEFLGTTKNEQTNKHDLDKETTKIEPGEEYAWFVSDDRGPLLQAMNKVKIGQKLRAYLAEFKPTQKGNPTKIIKVQPGFIKNKDGSMEPSMDKEFLESLKTENNFSTEITVDDLPDNM